MLDRLKATAAGLDGIPAWFLRLETRFLRHLSHGCLINPSLQVWYQVSGKPPSSRQYPWWSNRRIQLNLNQSLLHQYCHGHLSDSQSDHLLTLQSSNPTTSCFCRSARIQTNRLPFYTSYAPCYRSIRVYALDFSKAFDTVRHKTVMEKVARS